MGDFSHLNKSGEAAMVDVTAKVATERLATVGGTVKISEACMAKLTEAARHEISHTARIAGIQAAKQTSMLVPLCHQVPLTGVDIRIGIDRGESSFVIEVTTKTKAVTGVEMEALTAATIAGVTIYDMIKAVDPGATVGPFQLRDKRGGKSGPITLADAGA